MLQILESSPFVTIQDTGRTGWQRFGVPISGAMDAFALRAANQLVGNHWHSAALEIGPGSLSLRSWDDRLLALTGCGAGWQVNGRPMPAWTAVRVPCGAWVQVFPLDPGGWSYLAVGGGLDVPTVLGSRSTYARAGLGKAALQPGELLPLGPALLRPLAGRFLPPAKRPPYSHAPALAAIEGPQAANFTADAIERFYSSAYTLRSDSDRMGYRLQGQSLLPIASAELLSDGLVPGAVQVPASGQPVVLMSDSPTTGGYPKLAAVASFCLPLLAQCSPADVLTFYPLGVQAAQTAWRSLLLGLQHGIEEPEEDQLAMIQ